MFKKIFAVTLAAVILVAFASCGRPVIVEAPKPVKCYNGFLGLTVTIPAGWHTENINDMNLTGSPEESGSLSLLDLYGNGDNSVMEIELITMQNFTDSTRSDHTEIMLYADYAPGYSEADYLESLKNMISSQPSGGYTYELVKIEPYLIDGQSFTRFFVKVTIHGAGDNDAYFEEYYVAPVDDSYFVAYINYWDGSEMFVSGAGNTLADCFNLDSTGISKSGTADAGLQKM